MFFRFWLLKALPTRSDILLHLLSTSVAVGYNAWLARQQQILIVWLRRELARLDPDFGLDAISREKPQRPEHGEPVGSGTALSDSPDSHI